MKLNGVGFFALRLEFAMSDAELSCHDVAARIECSYEHIRKLIRAEALPSKPLLKELCRITRMDSIEARRLVTLDFCRHKYGSAFWSTLGRRPENDEFYVLWHFLTPFERHFFMEQIKWYVRKRPRLHK